MWPDPPALIIQSDQEILQSQEVENDIESMARGKHRYLYENQKCD